MAEYLPSKVVPTNRSRVLSLLAEDREFRQVFLDNPFKALDEYNLGLSHDMNSSLRDIMNYLPSDKPATCFNDKLVLCSAAPA